MAKREAPGVTIQFWRTGLYTHRSQLFAPIRTLGVNVIQMRDALIDGQDMEVTDLLEMSRRPGFSRYCSQQLAGGEIVNWFFSARTSNGTVIPQIDTNQRFASFSTSAITTLWTKPSADAAFSQMVGTQLYICNGTVNGQKRYDTGTAALHTMGIAAPATAPVVIPNLTANATFWQPGQVYGGLGHLIDPNGNVQLGGAGTSGTQVPLWATGLSVRTADGTVSGGWANEGPPGNWIAATAFFSIGTGHNSYIIDSNGNLQVCTVSGTSGATVPVWPTVINNTVADNTVTWTCKSNLGPVSIFSGFIYVYVYSTQAPTVTTGYYHCSTASPLSQSTGAVFGTYSYNVQGAFSTNTDVTSVDIYRIKDGGSVLNYCGSVVNNSAGGTWTFLDAVLDANLNTQITVPIGAAHTNDPPPGTTGSVAPSTDLLSQLTYWNGRMWGIAGNKVYFSAGGDCQNGDPNASWPPANVFTYPGQVYAITGTSAGMLVWLADTVKIIGGGPQTLTYFTQDLLENFGISSPHCLTKDGDTIRVLTTQKQQFTLTVQDKTEDGNFVADVIAANYSPSASYITNHRNGLDAGVFLSNGESFLLRYGMNLGCWSPVYKPVGGMKAIRSIETSVGVYSLCAARGTATGFILARDLTTQQDDGQNYTNCFITVGNIMLSEPRQELADLNWVILYLAATGSLPAVSILPNEISGTSGIGFVNLPGVQNEPYAGATASSTLFAKRWEVKSQQTLKASTLMHHLQVQIQFPQENFKNTVKVLSLQLGPDVT